MPEVVSKVELTEGEWQSSGAVLEVGGKASLADILGKSYCLLTLYFWFMVSRWGIVSDVDNRD